MKTLLHLLLALVVFGLSTAPLQAQPAGDDATRALARRLGEQGLEAYWEKDYVTAEQTLDRAFRLFATPTLALYSARARVELGRWVEAAERYREAVRVSAAVGNIEAQTRAQAEATEELKGLMPRIPSLTLVFDSAHAAGMQITLDGVSVPIAMLGLARPTDPGPHRIVAVRGTQRFEQPIELSEAEHRTVTISFQSDAATVPPPAVELAASSPSRVLAPLGWISLCAGGAALLVSGGAALLADDKLDACPNDQCRSRKDADAYESAKSVSTAAFYTGLGLAAGGALLLLLSPSERATERPVGMSVGAGGVIVRGRL